MKSFKFALSIYLRNIIIIIVSLILSVPFFAAADKHPFVFSLITSVICIAVIYSVAWKRGKLDSRNIHGFHPDIKVAASAATISAVIPFVLFVFRLINPDVLKLDLPFINGEYDFLITGFRVNGTPDFIFRLWYFCYGVFIPSGNLVVYGFVMLIQPLVIIIGYIVGLKRFDLSEFLYAKIVFSKGDSSERKEKMLR